MTPELPTVQVHGSWEELLFWGEQLKPISWEEALLLMEAAANYELEDSQQ